MSTLTPTARDDVVRLVARGPDAHTREGLLLRLMLALEGNAAHANGLACLTRAGAAYLRVPWSGPLVHR